MKSQSEFLLWPNPCDQHRRRWASRYGLCARTLGLPFPGWRTAHGSGCHVPPLRSSFLSSRKSPARVSSVIVRLLLLSFCRGWRVNCVSSTLSQRPSRKLQENIAADPSDWRRDQQSAILTIIVTIVSSIRSISNSSDHQSVAAAPPARCRQRLNQRTSSSCGSGQADPWSSGLVRGFGGRGRRFSGKAAAGQKILVDWMSWKTRRSWFEVKMQGRLKDLQTFRFLVQTEVWSGFVKHCPERAAT